MKKRKLFLALGLSFAFAFGLGATLSINRDVQAVQAEDASGTVKVYLNRLSWSFSHGRGNNDNGDFES